MKKKHLINLFFYSVLMLCAVNCAKKGNPTGGPIDENPPVFLYAEPPNYSTNFDGERIRIYFNEYIKLENQRKQLIISPPLNQPIISPQGAAAKYIEIEITDTLEANTTYVFNFGQSIVDNNEGNPFSYFKYVFSTGDEIDSLTVTGNIKDALLPEPDNFVTVMLYEVDSTLTDSVVYKERPRYITNTLDSLTTFELSNLREGTYLLVALKDEDGNYTFEPAKDKIAFAKEYITVPTDSSYTLELFKEKPDFSIGRPRYKTANTINFPVQGDLDSLAVNWLSQKPDGFEYLLVKDPASDTLNYWFRPKTEMDTVVLELRTPDYLDTVVARVRNSVPDSLRISALSRNTLNLKKAFELRGNNPITSMDTTLITVMEDSVPIPFKIRNTIKDATITVDFERKELKRFAITALPGAFTDFLGQKSDSLRFDTRTQEYSDYGDIELTLQGADEYPYIIQLTDEDGEVQEEQLASEGSVFTFSTLEPGSYYIRLVVDRNGNGRYDTGSYLEKRQPEEIIYYPKLIEVRKGWLPKETFTLN